MTCTFFGHRDLSIKTEPILLSTLGDLIENRNVDLFYVGNNGNFDYEVQKVLSQLNSRYKFEYYVVLSDIKQADNICRIKTIIPSGIEFVPNRFSIDFRNRWMIDESDYVVSFVNRTVCSNSAEYCKLAEKKGKLVINLGERIKGTNGV